MLAMLAPIGMILSLFALFSIGTTILPQKMANIFRTQGNRQDFVAYVLVLLVTAFVQPVVGTAIVALAQPQLSPAASLALIIVTCCPGGSFSNIISYVAGANVPLNAALTMSEVLLSFVLVPVGLLVVLPHLLEGRAEAHAVPFGPMVAALLQLFVPLSVGIAMAPRAQRHTRLVRRCGKVLVSLVCVYVIVFLVVAGPPPVALLSIECVAAFTAAGVVIALVVGAAARQPQPNRISMLLEINVRDSAMAQAILFIGFAQAPFAYRYEAIGVVMLFTLYVNTLALALVLLRLGVVRALARRRARCAEDPHSHLVVHQQGGGTSDDGGLESYGVCLQEREAAAAKSSSAEAEPVASTGHTR